MTTGRKRRLPIPRAVAAAGGRDLAKIGVARFDIRDPYHAALTTTWPRFALIVLGLYLALNVLFASLYAASPGAVANTRPGSILDDFFFSMETLATVGYGQMYPATTYGHVVSVIEIMSGMAFTAIMTGLIFVRFSKPRAKILYADHPVVTTYNGLPTLMLRIANGRTDVLTDLNASLNALVQESTQEGHNFRRVLELKLVRSYVPMFPLTLTLMHPIDEQSPLFGHTAASLTAGGARLFLSVAAHDTGINSDVHVVKDYDGSHIKFGMRYADAIIQDENGRTIADLTRLSLIEPDAAWAAAWGEDSDAKRRSESA